LPHFSSARYFRQSAAFEKRSWNSNNDRLLNLSKYYQQVPRDFIELLIYCRKHRISKERLYDAEQALLRICPTDINTEKLMALLGNTTSPRPTTVHGHDKKIQQASKAHLLALTNLVGN
jgi:hypothetical protein